VQSASQAWVSRDILKRLSVFVYCLRIRRGLRSRRNNLHLAFTKAAPNGAAFFMPVTSGAS
jgi:hypothetical protein